MTQKHQRGISRTADIMGAWGYGLFEGDHDYDVVSDLTGEAGLYDLQEQDIAKARAPEPEKPSKKTSSKQAPNADAETEDDEDEIERCIYYSVFAGHCSDIDTVRTYLETSGAMDKLIDKYTAAFHATKKVEVWYGPEYKLVLLAACAMSLGVKLRPDFKKLVDKLYAHVGLMELGQKQMEKALKEYKGGERYEFDYDLIETPPPKKSNGAFTMLNVDGVGTMFGRPPKKQVYPENLCGACGSAGEEGKGLLLCAKCKKRKYCDRDCQKIHWSAHKKECKPAA